MTNRKFIATLLVGALFGAAVLLTMRGHDLDLLYLQLRKCTMDKQQLEEDVHKLTLDLTNAKKENTRRLRKINVIVQTAPDEFTKLSVQKRVKLLLHPLLDKELTLLEAQPEVIRGLLENQVIELPTETVKLHVSFAAIGETTSVYVDAVKEATTVKPFAEPGTP